MTEAEGLERRQELGDFVRAQREKLDPALVGLPAGGRRRTPGLRREEVAQLCGLSVTWYTWLEQGREISVSPNALARLARALRLGRAQRAYLFELAGKRDPDAPANDPEPIPTAVLASLEAIAAPAYLLDRCWSARGWNAPAERLFTGWLDRPGERNLLRFIFLDPAAPALICDWGARARRVVAEFRADLAGLAMDATTRSLIDDLRGQSRDFLSFWDEHGVLGREGGERRFRHPIEGVLRFEQATFTVAGRPDLKLTILLAPRATRGP
jgi:transcriptional regulator with XRE-family HTH domain